MSGRVRTCQSGRWVGTADAPKFDAGQGQVAERATARIACHDAPRRSPHRLRINDARRSNLSRRLATCHQVSAGMMGATTGGGQPGTSVNALRSGAKGPDRGKSRHCLPRVHGSEFESCRDSNPLVARPGSTKDCGTLAWPRCTSEVLRRAGLTVDRDGSVLDALRSQRGRWGGRMGERRVTAPATLRRLPFAARRERPPVAEAV